MLKKTKAYYKKHVCYGAMVNIIFGMGVGVLITHPFIDPHPVRVGVILVAIGILGSLYPLVVKK